MSQRLTPIISLPADLEPHVRQALTKEFRRILDQINILSYDTTAVSATHVASQNLILADANAGTLTVKLMPVTKIRDKVISIKKTDAGANQVFLVSSDGIDGVNTLTISGQYSMRSVMSDGKTWHVVGTYP